MLDPFTINPKFKRPEWFPDWKGHIAVVVASGPSAGAIDYAPYKGRAKFIACNYSYKLVPWADAMIGADLGFWNQHKGCKDFAGLKMTTDDAGVRPYGLNLVRLDKLTYGFSIHQPGYVGMGANTGFYAINITLQFGPPKGIIICGFDMQGSHWHGPHPRGMNNPGPVQFNKWAPLLDKQSKFLDRLGVPLINASVESRLQNFPKMPFDKAFAAMES